MAHRVRRGTALLLAASLFACEGQDRDTGVRVDTLASGTIRASNPTPDRPLGWTAVEDLRIGATMTEAGARDGPAFSYIADVTVDAAGNIYVLDGLEQAVFVFDARGTLLQTVGSKGRGPAEFIGAEDVEIAPDGRLWVLDTRLRRYSVFEPDGSLAATYVRPINGFTHWSVGAETVVDWAMSFLSEGPEVVAGERVVFTPIRIDVATGVADTFPPLVLDQNMLPDGSRPNPIYNRRLHLQTAHDGGVWFTTSHRYELLNRSLSGDTLLIASLATEPLPVTAADIDSLRRVYGDRPQMEPYLREAPSVKPIIDEFTVDPAGYLYVAANRPGLAAGYGLDVFDEHGTFLGSLALPVPIDVRPGFEVDGEYLYAVIRGQMDVPYVARLRVTRQP